MVFERLYLDGERNVHRLMQQADISERTVYNYRAKLDRGESGAESAETQSNQIYSYGTTLIRPTTRH
jgi:hypothetical protein